MASEALLNPEREARFGTIIPRNHIPIDQRDLPKIQIRVKLVVSADAAGFYRLAVGVLKHGESLS
jgi:hypothetical protein